MSARFLISILSMRLASGVQRCVESVLAAGGDFDLILTANGSQECESYFRSLKNLSSRHGSGGGVPAVKVVSNVKNLGFIAPNNEAFSYAEENGYDFFITLNDDSTVPNGWLESIEAEFARHPAAAIVGPHGGCRSLDHKLDGSAGTNLDYVEGSAACYRVSVVARHFKTLYPDWLTGAYFEDSAVSLLVQQLGYTIHEANFSIEHTRCATSVHVPEVKQWRAANQAAATKRFAHWLKYRTFSHRVIVRRWAATGDVLLVTAILEALWRKYPLCTIHVETLFPELFAGNPFVTSAGKGVGRQPTDLVIDLDGTYEATPMRHIVRSYAKAADVEISSTETFYRVPAKDAAWAAVAIPSPSGNWTGNVAIHAGLSTWPSKNWPLERWAEIIGGLNAAGYLTILVGAQTNPELRAIAGLDLTGLTTIPQLFAVMARCAFCVSIDSFPLHAAQAVGTPVVGLFGVTTPELICTDGSRWVAARSDKYHADTGLRHRIAGQVMIQADGSVMETISVQQVLSAIEEIRAPAQTLSK